MKRVILIICAVIFTANLSAQDRGRPITLSGFGVPVPVPGSQGDTWASAWSADDSVWIMNNDGAGIIGARSGAHNYLAHTYINQIPASFNPENSASLTNQRDGRRIVHPLNRNDFTARYFGNFQNPQPWYPYSTDIYEIDGVLYCNFVYSNQIPGNWGFLYSNFMRSTDGGRTWQNHKEQTDMRSEASWEDAFFPQGWETTMFVKYGRGGAAPNVDRAHEYIYFICNNWRIKYNPPGGTGVYIARIKRSDLREWKTTPDGNGDNVRKKLEFLSYGLINTLANARAAENNSHWTADYSRAKPISDKLHFNITYNESLRRYFAASINSDSFTNPKIESSIQVFEAPYPWGPWTEIINEHMQAKADDNLTLTYLSQKYISDDGFKMWMAVSGAQAENSHTGIDGYFLKFLPIFLTSEPVQTIIATNNEKVTVNGLSRQTHREHVWEAWRFPGGSSTGYGGFTSDGNSLSFNVSAPSAGDYIVNFRYRTKGVPPWTNIAAYRRDPFPTISLYVNNNKAKQLKLGRSIQTYSEWTEMSIFLRLNAGNNTVTFQRDRGDVSDSIVISRLKYALYTGSSPLPLDNVGVQPVAISQPSMSVSTGTQAVISSWNTTPGNGSSINVRTTNKENIGGERYTTWTITGSLAPDSYAVAVGTPDSATLRAMRTMSSISFTILGDGKKYLVALPTRETNQIHDHYLLVFSTVAGEVITVTIFVADLAQGGHTGRQVAFNQNNIQQIQFQPVDQGAFNLKVWDIRLH